MTELGKTGAATRMDNNRDWSQDGLAYGRLCGVITLLVSVAPVDAALPESRSLMFSCRGGTSFSAQLGRHAATMNVNGQRYQLQRKPFSFGDRFVSDVGTLVIDGDYGTFIGKELPAMRGCKTKDAAFRR